MKQEINLLIEQLKETWEGDPWFGRNASVLLGEVSEQAAFEKISGQHSILELVWHMCNWREFVISHLAPSEKSLAHFEHNDWQNLDHTNKSLWPEGRKRLQQTQDELIRLLQQKDDSILAQNVSERTYPYRKLLTGIIQHDIYHLGQIAFLTKALKASGTE
ncbi:DinB family protein [Flavisolibacter nicotianae]|uniref:DinB family protein n=1 Tax=Flavisolibacter nicotianae TaxID=2364882 RepID=UPI000EAF4A73|nr:DinB family protein [Flavisolibacter nicotianae]